MTAPDLSEIQVSQQSHKNRTTRETGGMKNVRSSGSASRLIMHCQLIQETTGCEFPFTCFNPKSCRLYELFQHICLSCKCNARVILTALLSLRRRPLRPFRFPQGLLPQLYQAFSGGPQGSLPGTAREQKANFSRIYSCVLYS